jgi:hypothetical protein
MMGPRLEPFARADLEAHDRLRPLLERLQRLTARVMDAALAA